MTTPLYQGTGGHNYIEDEDVENTTHQNHTEDEYLGLAHEAGWYDAKELVIPYSVFVEALTTYGAQRAEEGAQQGAQQARKHYYDKVDREAREKEAYLWFNTWYEKNIDPGNKQCFGKWASERLQELGLTQHDTSHHE